MSNKPKIYAPCKAGCEWETVHKEDFERSASHIRQNIGANGRCSLKIGKEYKIFSPKDTDGNFTAKIKTECLLFPSGVDKGAWEDYTHTFTLPNADEYAEYFVFRFFVKGAYQGNNTLIFTYECGGVRYTETVTVTEGALIQPSDYIYVEGATDVLLYNADATIIAEKGDKGDKGDAGKDADYQLGETDGTAYEGSKGAKNARDIQNLFAITAQNGLYSVLELAQAFTTRQTADGENIVDGQYVFPKLIKGKTVAIESGLKHANFKAIKSTGKQLFSKSTYSFSSGTQYGVAITVNADGSITAKGTATSRVDLTLGNYTKDMLQAGTYYIAGSVTGVTSINIDCYKDTTYVKSFGVANRKITLDWNGYNIVRFYYNIASGTAIDTNLYPMLNFGETAQPFEPYTEEEYGNGNTYELAEYDYINPQTGEIVRQTETITFDGSKAWITGGENGGTVSGWYSKPTKWFAYNEYNNDIISTKPLDGNKALYNFHKSFPNGTTLEEVQAYYDGIVVAGKLKTPTVETLDLPKEYTAHNGGSETIIQGETDNSADGAIATLTNEYFKLTEV